MKGQLTDLDEMLQKVRSSYAKGYLSEAIAAYRSGSYRASVITTWIAVCVDIIEKIRELGHAGDPLAVKEAQRIDHINSNDFATMMKLEKNLLKIASDDLELISPIEKAHLERLKDDRNICAHPTFSYDGSQFNPGPEMARAYIVQAANYLLINPPTKGKATVNITFNLINEESFPKDKEKIFSVLSSHSYLGRAQESSIRNLCIILLKRVLKDQNNISQDFLMKIAFSLDGISRINPTAYNSVIKEKFTQFVSETDEVRLIRLLPLLYYKADLWDRVDNATRHRLEGIINTMTVEDIIKYKTVELSDSNITVRTYLMSKVENLDKYQLIKLLESTTSRTLKEPAIKSFTCAPSFDSAYHRGTKILLPHAIFFEAKDIKNIFDGIFKNQTSRINQILNAGGIDSVFAQLYQDTKGRVEEHSKLWLHFWKENSEKYELHDLRAILEKDKLIEPSEREDIGALGDHPSY